MEFFDGKVALTCGDARDVLASLPSDHFHACATDPPYALESIIKRFANTSTDDATQTSERARQRTDPMARHSRGFMGHAWDTGAVAHDAKFWREVRRVLRPGAHLVAFGGTRTYHHLVGAIEEAGFEIRDTLMYLYGSGFPKSLNIGGGLGTALKPAVEPIVLARKPLSENTVAANVKRWATGALNIDACRVDGISPAVDRGASARGSDHAPTRPGQYGPTIVDRTSAERYMAEHPGEMLGRWPANVLHDGSAEVVGLFPDAPGQQRAVDEGSMRNPDTPVYDNGLGRRHGFAPRGDSGSAARFFASVGPRVFVRTVKPDRDDGYRMDAKRATIGINRNDDGSVARFFYTAKVDSTERLGSRHPTIKPLALMQWLVRLVCVPGGLVLDPFAGTGTTGEACLNEDMRCVLIERESNYCADIERRMALARSGPMERMNVVGKVKGADDDAGPLFAFAQASNQGRTTMEDESDAGHSNVIDTTDTTTATEASGGGPDRQQQQAQGPAADPGE